MNETGSRLASRPRFGTWLTKTAWIVYGVCSVVFLSLAFLPSGWVTEDQAKGQLKTITIVNPFVSRTHMILALLSFALLLLLGAVGLMIKRFPAAWVALVIALIGFPVCYGKSVIDNLEAWTTEAEIQTPDNRIYYFMDSSFLQGQTMAIARLKGHTWLTTEMEVLGTTNGDNPRSWASVIRPAGTPANDYGQLYLSSDKTMLIGIRTGFKCYMSYDLRGNHFRGNSDEDADDIKGVSPFLLIGEDTEMNPVDVKEVIDHINSHTAKGHDNGYPRLNVLEADLDHPNAKVRLMAKKLIGIIKSHQARVIR